MVSLLILIAISFGPQSARASEFDTYCESSLIGLTSISTLPIVTYEPGETPLEAGSTTGLLLILKKGSVVVMKNGIEMAFVTEPGAVFGELSALLGKPHTADVRVLETTQFYVAKADAILGQNPVALLYVAAVLAQRLDSGNETLVDLKKQVQQGGSRRVIEKTIEKLEKQLQFFTPVN